MIALWSILRSKIAQAVGVVALVLGVLWDQRRRGRKQARQDIARKADQAAQKRRDIRNEIESDIRPANAADELRDKWRRDN